MIPWPLLFALACSTSAPEPEPVRATNPSPPPSTEAPAPTTPSAPTEERYAATHVLVAWQGAANAPAAVTRAQPEARALAEAIRSRALGGEPLEALARAHSDGPSAPRGGVLGVYRTGTMVPEFEIAVAGVEPGGIGPLVESPFGYHVVRRDPVVEGRFAHILVTWKGAWRSSGERSRDEARARADQALERLRAGEPFAVVARELSDDATASAGGDLGLVAPGQMVPAFDEAAFALQVGGISEVFETPYGWHLAHRLE